MMAKAKPAPASAGTQINDAATLIYVAYHAGPPEIQFAGRRWVKGAAQALTTEEWGALRSRPDAAAFEFKLDNQED